MTLWPTQPQEIKTTLLKTEYRHSKLLSLVSSSIPRIFFFCYCQYHRRMLSKQFLPKIKPRSFLMVNHWQDGREALGKLTTHTGLRLPQKQQTQSNTKDFYCTTGPFLPATASHFLASSKTSKKASTSKTRINEKTNIMKRQILKGRKGMCAISLCKEEFHAS